VSESPLACTVRGCATRLVRRPPGLVCERGHAFDRARSGYVNLLQPQDRRSPTPGDARTEIEARARLYAAGLGAALAEELGRAAAALALPAGSIAVDLGAGAGDFLAGLCAASGLAGIGIDLAAPAMELAARRFPEHTWIVANADRRLPLLDRSVALVLSVHGRRNPAECARVLAPGGHLLVALPAADDLVELRAHVQGAGLERERVSSFLAEHAGFELVARSAARATVHATREQLHDLLQGT
jgi:23S rRNA (guanine745-N1)-methyltransferase